MADDRGDGGGGGGYIAGIKTGDLAFPFAFA